ncbi:uncharacterized protein LOC116845741 [Odontomachus brunneus]|uniref:uncharacterized protein LOC116845741 n=1 Tax=Odontomachus brunneus TaxID=486640 RepID=UPI0013F1CF0E|nr:uncharacterized protein LOC116845741 [Odontomachus brunneus]
MEIIRTLFYRVRTFSGLTKMIRTYLYRARISQVPTQSTEMVRIPTPSDISFLFRSFSGSRVAWVQSINVVTSSDEADRLIDLINIKGEDAVRACSERIEAGLAPRGSLGDGCGASMS